MLLSRLNEDGSADVLGPPRDGRTYTRRNGNTMTPVTLAEYESKLAEAPDENVHHLSVSLDWVDASVISVTTFGGVERLSNRLQGIAVGLSGCVKPVT